ncbi:MAG: DUF3276 family protein [Spirochaetota bacterium]|nr:DUF3276 family protein [Spirochaetota bacterium]
MDRDRRELFSEKITAGSRTYFFDVKKSANGSKYLLISESRKDEEGSFERNRVMVFEEHLIKFHNALEKVVQFVTEAEEA